MSVAVKSYRPAAMPGTMVSNDTFSQKQIPAFAQACYTQADISDAAKAASKDEASKDDTSSDKS